MTSKNFENLSKKTKTENFKLSKIIAVVEEYGLSIEEFSLLSNLNINLLEVRFDSFPNIKEAIEFCKIANKKNYKILVTNRNYFEKKVSDKYRYEFIKEIFEFADIIDLEFEDPLIKDLIIFIQNQNLNQIQNNNKKIKILLSSHNFKETPDTNSIFKVFEFGKNLKVDYIKVAYLVQTQLDLQRLNSISLDYLQSFKSEEQNVKNEINFNPELIWVGMGEWGKSTRFTSIIYGSPFSYAYIRKPNAPGQLSIYELDQLLKNFCPNY